MRLLVSGEGAKESGAKPEAGQGASEFRLEQDDDQEKPDPEEVL
jgi:hypothetical protein